MQCRYVLCLLVVLFFSCCGSKRTTVTVSAAMSLKDAFIGIGGLFNKSNKKFRVVFNFASSGALARQIEAGAPCDVYASASVKEMNRLGRRGLIVTGSRCNFAGNSIVAIAPIRSDLRADSIAALYTAAPERIAVGNPATVPAGRYALQRLRSSAGFDRIREKLVFCEHVRQVLDYVVRGEANAGLVYTTDWAVRRSRVRLLFRLPSAGHEQIHYPIALINRSGNRYGGKIFMQFLKSGTGRRMLRKHGFTVP